MQNGRFPCEKRPLDSQGTRCPLSCAPGSACLLLSVLRCGGSAFGQCVQLFTGFEAHGLTWRNADFGSGSGISPDTGFACAHAEHSETTQFNALTRCQGLFQPLKHSIDCRFGLGAGQACALDHMVHNVLFNQSGHLACATVLDCTTPYRIDGTAFGSFVEQRAGGFLHIVTRCSGKAGKGFL